jgi:hypothetical protein
MRHFGGIRARMLEYSPGHASDYWCVKGHILLCLEGTYTWSRRTDAPLCCARGMSYQVGEGAEPHRSSAPSGDKLYVVG